MLDYDMTDDSPIKITLQSPVDGTTTMDNVPDFKFIPTHDDSLALSCSLWLQDATSSYIYATIDNVNSGSLTTLTTSVPMPNGSWSWWINCTTGADSSVSEQRTITIDTFRGDKTFTSTLDGSVRMYWLDLPDNFDNLTPTSLVVFLHGYGGSTELSTKISDTETNIPKQFLGRRVSGLPHDRRLPELVYRTIKKRHHRRFEHSQKRL